jgi:hypothetical protein
MEALHGLRAEFLGSKSILELNRPAGYHVAIPTASGFQIQKPRSTCGFLCSLSVPPNLAADTSN